MASPITTPGLIDTDILIDAQHQIPPAVAFLSIQQATAGIQISIVTAMELVVGCRNTNDLAKVQQFLQGVAVLPVSPSVSQNAFHLVETFFLSHGLAIADALIAATALEQSLVLFTRNIRHFQMIPGFTVVAPY